MHEGIQEQLLQIFTHRWSWIVKESDSWKTVKTRISDKTLIKIYQDPQKLIGVGFGEHTQYLMVDIDKNSPYHPHNDPNAVPLLELTLYKIGLKENIKIQSSQSGGIHIYYPLAHQLKSYKVGVRITEYLEDNGWIVKNGVLEIFPNRKKDNLTQDKSQWKLYQRHRLPLQPESGSYLLDNHYQPLIEHPSPLESFCDQWESIAKAQDIKELKRYLYIGKRKSRVLSQIETELNELISEGFTGHGQTNDILLKLGRKIRLCRQLGGAELRDTIRHTITHMGGYEKYCGHQYEIYQRCQDIARWAENSYPLASERKSQELPKPKTNNHIKAREALGRIIQALTTAIKKEYETVTAFIKEVCAMAQCSASTLYKHQKLWREKVKIKMVCNSIQDKTLSPIDQPELTQERTDLKSIQNKELREKKEKEKKQTKKQENECNSRQSKSLSLDWIDKYILRIYMLSSTLAEKKEIRNNKQKAVVKKTKELKVTEGIVEKPKPSESSFITEVTTSELQPLQSSSIGLEATEVIPRQSKAPEALSTVSQAEELELEKSGEEELKVSGLETVSLESGIGKLEPTEMIPQECVSQRLRASQKVKSDVVKPELTKATPSMGESVELEATETTELEVETSKVAQSKAQAPVITHGTKGGNSIHKPEQSIKSSPMPHGNNSEDVEDKLTQERNKFLKGLGIEIPEKLMELVNQTTIEQLNNLRQLLKENKTLNNPVGFLIKALKNNWQPKQKTATPSKPSWQEEFEEFYHQAIKAGYCDDLPINWLSRNSRNEPMVRVNKPDSWVGSPYTLVYWREAMQEFWGNNDK